MYNVYKYYVLCVCVCKGWMVCVYRLSVGGGGGKIRGKWTRNRVVVEMIDIMYVKY